VGITLLGRIATRVSRRRLIEGGLVVLAAALVGLGAAQWFVPADAQGPVTLLGVVVAVAFIAGVTYAFVADPAQTALQEELPEDVRGRVFGVLNTLVSLASFLPIIVVGPLADFVGTQVVILASAVVIALPAVGSWFLGAPVEGRGITKQRESTDPVTIAATSSTLMRPPRLRYLDEPATTPVGPYSAVTPGIRGPRPPEAPVGGSDPA
jgi:MFS family permease